MYKIISKDILEELNIIMLNRGAPVERDYKGYNVPDHNKLSHIWFGASNSDLYEISARLLKYYNTQLINQVNFTKEDLVNTSEYYKDLISKDITRPSITMSFVDDYKSLYVGFKYNLDIISIMRKYKFVFEREKKAWKGNSSYAKSILKECKAIGIDVANALLYIESIELNHGINTDEQLCVIKNSINPMKVLTVKPFEGDTISLEFKYDDELLSEIKNLKYKKFNWDEKVWIINKFEATNLYNNIRHLNYDLSELKRYMNNHAHIKIVNIKETNLEISFPYHPNIIENIKNLNYYKYNKKNITWEIDIREKDMFIELVKDIADTSELEKIEHIDNKQIYDIRDYSYLKRKPYPHQLDAATFLLKNKKALIGDEMGTGKTMSSILASYSLPSPRLIICPASLKLNWAKEIRMIDYEGNINIVGENKLDKTADWVIINYDILEREYHNIKKLSFTSITLDEAHYIKSVDNSGKPKSKRAEYSINLAKKIEYVFALTGTPITNKPKDIFNILKISDHILSKNFFNFAQKYCGAEHNGFGWNFEGSSNEDELHELIKPIMLRRLKSQMLDLPEKIRRFIPVEINMKSYYSAVEDYKKNRNTITNTGEHLAYLAALRHILAKEKVPSTIEIADTILDSGEQLVIFTNYNAVVNKLMSKYTDIAVKITGSCTAKERQSAVDEFQNGTKKLIIANIIAGGVGLTLIKSNNLIFNDFDWIPANHFQAEDRIHRIGQAKNCTINYIYASGAEIDEYMIEMLETKSTAINKIVDAGKGEQLNIAMGMIESLYRAR